MLYTVSMTGRVSIAMIIIIIIIVITVIIVIIILAAHTARIMPKFLHNHAHATFGHAYSNVLVKTCFKILCM